MYDSCRGVAEYHCSPNIQVEQQHGGMNCPSTSLGMYSVVQITSDRFGEICKFRSRGSLALLSLGVGIDQ